MIDFNLHKIFVEGQTDQAFIQFVLEEKFGIELNKEQVNNAIISCQGWSNIKNQTGILQDRIRLENNGKNIVVFDADGKSNDGGFKKRKGELEQIAKNLNVKFDVFLFPDDESDGDLELFYSSCFKADKAFFKDCWNNIYGCLESNKKELKLKYPKSAEMVFSYVDLFEEYKSEEYKNSKSKRSYFDENLWEFDFDQNEYLKKLISFLKEHLKE
jgi:hypothetical protein